MRHGRDGGLFYQAIPAGIAGRFLARRRPLFEVGRIVGPIRAVLVGKGIGCRTLLCAVAVPVSCVCVWTVEARDSRIAARALSALRRRVTFFSLVLCLTAFAHTSVAQDDGAEAMRRKRAEIIRRETNNAPQNDDPEIQRVVKAWQDRAAHITSARIKWKLTRTDKAGAMNSVPGMNVRDGDVAPPTDTAYRETFELLYKDGRIRVHSVGQSFLAGESKLQDVELVQGFLAGRFRHLTISQTKDPSRNGGIVWNGDDFAPLKSIDGLPLALTLTPFSAEYSILGPRRLSRAPQRDDSESVCLQVGERPTFAWASKGDASQLVRHEVWRDDDSIATQVQIKWQYTSTGIAIPESWLLTSFDQDQRIRWVTNVVVSSFVVNEEISDEELEVVFPEGTLVVDLVQGIEGVADSDGQVVAGSFSGGKRTSHNMQIACTVFLAFIMGVAFMTRRRRFLAFVGVAMFVAQAAHAAEQSSDELLRKSAEEIRASRFKGPRKDDPEINRVVKSWKERAARIKTARIKWTLTRMDKAGSFSGRRVVSEKRSGSFPLTDTTTELRCELLYQKGQVRLEEHGQFWMVDFDRPIDTHKTYGYKADELSFFCQSKEIGDSVGMGTMARAEMVDSLCSSESAPVAIAISPIDARISKWSQDGPLERSPSDDDADAFCFHVQPFGSYFWIANGAPERAVRFQSRRRDGTTAHETVVEWQDVDGIGAVPKQWVLTQFDRDGTITHVVSGKVTEFEFNIPLFARDLEVVFPAGARVHDDVRQVMLLSDGAGGFVPYSEGGRASSGLGVKSILGATILFLSSILVIRLWRERRSVMRTN